MSVALPHHLQARATYSHHDARFRDFVQEFDGVPTQLAGKRIEMSAASLASAGLVIAPDTGVVANLVVKSVGSGYRFGAWEIRVDGRNLTDRRDPVIHMGP